MREMLMTRVDRRAGSAVAAAASLPIRSPKALVNCVQLVISLGVPAAVGRLKSTNLVIPGAASGSLASRWILSGTTPMKPAVLVLTPAMALIAEGTSST
jgi:hypothetical protein